MEEALKVVGKKMGLTKEYSLDIGSWIGISNNEEEIINSSMEIAEHLPLPDPQESGSTDKIDNSADIKAAVVDSHTTEVGTEKTNQTAFTDQDPSSTHDDQTHSKGPQAIEEVDTELKSPAKDQIEQIESDSIKDGKEKLPEKQKIHVNTLKRDTSQISSISVGSSPYKRDLSDAAAFSPLMSGAVRSVNPIIEQVLKSIQLLEENDESLKNLDLKDVQVFTNLHGAKLAKALEQNTNLEVLDLSNTKLQTNTAIEIAKALEVNKGLKVLNMSNNHIQPEGMREIAQMLKVNTCLRELVLSNQKYSTGSNAEEAFAEALKKNNTLVKLALKINGAPARTAIDRGLSKNNALAKSADQ